MNIYKFDPSVLKSPITFIYNGNNKRWAEEAKFLKNKDKDGKLKLVDASAAGADLGSGVSADAAKNTVFARDAAGTVVHGVDALYAAFNEIGFGSWFHLYRIPGLLSEGTGFHPEQQH